MMDCSIVDTEGLLSLVELHLGVQSEVRDNLARVVDYYRLLHNHYQEWYDKYDYSPKMLIKTDNIDITCDDDWQQVFGQIKDKMQALGIGD